MNIDEPREIRLPVEYQASGGRTNADFKGAGLLELRLEGGVLAGCRFTGRRRRMVGTGPEDSMEFAESEIRNAVRSGACLQFSTTKGDSGREGGVFVWHCRDEAEADRVLSILPARCDPEFLEQLDFSGRLARLESGAHPLLSVTHLLMAANVVVFLLMAGLLGAGWTETANLAPYIRFGANNGAVTTDGEWWRLFTHQFMHFGLMHLGFNLWALYQGGHFVERLQGRALYLLSYLASGACGGLLSILWHGDKVWSAGASGAIFGVFGCVLGYLLRERQALPASVYKPMLRSTLVFAGYNLVFGLVYPGIDNAAHAGGFLSGALFGWLGSMPLEPARRRAVLPARLAAVLAAASCLLAAGVFFSPRYSYNLREEEAFSEQVAPLGVRETRLVERLQAPIEAWTKAGGPMGDSSLEALLRDEALPCYSAMVSIARSMHFKPEKSTSRRAAALLAYAEARQAAFAALLTAVRSGDAKAYQAYVEASERAEKASGGIGASR